MRDGIDEYTLLCENCGYVIEGLALDGQCPECGKLVAESLPERRVGTAWQRDPCLTTLIQTWTDAVFHPRLLLDLMRFDQRSNLRLRVFAASVSAMSAFSFVAAFYFVIANGFGASFWRVVTDPGELFLPIALGAALIAFILVITLIFIERCGLVFLGRRHGRRITRKVASVICDHGSAGWAFGSVAFGLFTWIAAVCTSIRATDAMTLPFFFLGVGSLLAGFIVFEVFAYLGLRRCKFANRDRPAEESPQEKN